MKNNQIEESLNNEATKLVGYVMPVLESMKATNEQKQSIKKILYAFKNNCVMLINEMTQNDKSNNKT